MLLIGQVLTRPAWLMTLFIFLACIVPFAGGMRPFRGDAFQMLDPFGFSLLTPSRGDFGLHSLLSLFAMLLIPALLIFWRRSERELTLAGAGEPFKNGILPLSAILIYCIFLIVSLPLVVRSSAFPTGAALMFTYLDLIVTAVFIALIVDFAIIMTPWHRMKALVAFIVAGGAHLFRCMADTFLISGEARDLVASDWSALTVHFILAVVASTLYALPLPQFKTRATE